MCEIGEHKRSMLIDDKLDTMAVTDKGVVKFRMWWCDLCSIVWGEMIVIDTKTGGTSNLKQRWSSKS